MTGISPLWPRLPLRSLLRIEHGFAFKSRFFSDEPGDIVLTPGNFEETGGLKFRAEKDRSYVGPFPDEFRLKAGDLLVVMTDLTQEARILGAPAFAPDGVRCLHNQRLGKIVDVDETRLNRRFLYYVFNHPQFREAVKATASGSTVKHTSPSRIGDFEIALPPLGVQHRIASILGAYDDLIEVNRRRIALLEEMTRRLFEEWFVHFRFPGHEYPPQPEYNGLVLSITSSDPFVAHAVATSNGTKMPRANWSVLAKTLVPLPPERLLSKFNDAVFAWAEFAALLNSTNVRLAAARNLLLPRLISGEHSYRPPSVSWRRRSE
jgi:restriction endonuclease S subunit